MNLREKPYNLNDKEVAWVEEKLSALSLEQKVGQLFCLMGGDYPIEQLESIVGEKGVGAILYRPAPVSEIAANYEKLDKVAPAPLLKAANLEEGGSGGTSDDTLFGWPMTVGATGDSNVCKNFAQACAFRGKTGGNKLDIFSSF